MSKTKHLDTALAILRGSPAAKRAKGTTFTLYVAVDGAYMNRYCGLLQGPRGKTVKMFFGTVEECKAQARAHAAKLGASLTIYE